MFYEVVASYYIRTKLDKSSSGTGAIQLPSLVGICSVSNRRTAGSQSIGKHFPLWQAMCAATTSEGSIIHTVSIWKELQFSCKISLLPETMRLRCTHGCIRRNNVHHPKHSWRNEMWHSVTVSFRQILKSVVSNVACIRTGNKFKSISFLSLYMRWKSTIPNHAKLSIFRVQIYLQRPNLYIYIYICTMYLYICIA